MRTLKKSLCLVLAVVMILGLGAFSVNAQYTTKDYSDAKKISHGEAVDVLGAIGVLEGDDNDGDGKIDYRPDDKLTRAQATKIITSMLGVTAVTAVAPFADVGADVAWAKDYIAYCAEQGIVEGVDDENNLFDPQGELTGGAFAKMLLTAMGYDATIEGMGGTTSWLINVAKLVRTNNLDKGIASFPYDEAITRDDAAQLAFNALCAPLVGYDNKGGTMNVNGVTITTAPTTAHYMTTTVRDTQTISYALVNDGSTSGTYIVEFAEKYQPKLVRVTTDKDDFGRPCTTWTYNREQIGTYTNESLQVASWNGKFTNSDAYKAIGGDLMTKVKQGNNLYGQGYTFNVYVNGISLDDIKGSDKYAEYLDKWEKNNSDKFGSAGQITEIYIDDDVYALQTRVTQITVVVIDTFLGEVSAAKNSKGEAKVTVVVEDTEEFGGVVCTVKEEDVANIGDFKEGDKVLVQAVDPFNKVSKRSVKIVLPASKLEDVYINAYTADKGKIDSVTYDGSTYSVACQARWNKEILTNYMKRDLKGFTYDLYKDQFDNLIGIDFNKTDTDYVFVTAIQGGSGDYLTSGSVTASLIYTDGKMETKTVSLSDASNATAREYFTSLKTIGYNTGTINYYDPVTAAASTDYFRAPVVKADGAVGVVYNGNGRSIQNSSNTNGAIVNRWFTYSKDDSGKITLRNAVGVIRSDKTEPATGNILQRAITMDVAGKGKVDIGSSAATLQTGASTYAFGNDKSVYITVGVDTGPVQGGSITKVNQVTTGIKNVSIALLDVNAKAKDLYQKNVGVAGTYAGDSTKSATAKAATSKEVTLNNFGLYLNTDTTQDDNTGRSWNNVFFVYDNNTHYVLYAVAISEVGSKNVLFITSDGPTKSEYINGIGYVDTYTGIRDGQKVTVQVDRDKSDTNDTKMEARNMYHVDYNADGMITYADTNALGTSDEMNTDSNRTNGYAIQIGTTSATVDIKGNTLYVGSGTDRYIILDSKTTFFVAKGDATGADDYNEYRTATSAYNAATEDKGEITSVYAECDGNTGFAKSVIFLVNGSGSATSKNGIVDVIMPSAIDGTTYTINGINPVTSNTAIVLYNNKIDADTVVEEVTNRLIALGRTIDKTEISSGEIKIYTSKGSMSYTPLVVDMNKSVIQSNAYTSGSTLNADLSGNLTVAKGDNLTVKGSGNITVSGDAFIDGSLTVPVGSELTINGKTLITTNGHIYNYGTITYNGETHVGGTSIEIGTSGKAIFKSNVYVSGALINNGEIDATNKTIEVEQGGTLTLANNSTTTADAISSKGSVSKTDSAKINVTKVNNVTQVVTGEFNNSSAKKITYNLSYVVSADVAALTVKAGSFTAGSGVYTVTFDTTVVDTALKTKNADGNWVTLESVSGYMLVTGPTGVKLDGSTTTLRKDFTSVTRIDGFTVSLPESTASPSNAKVEFVVTNLNWNTSST